MSKWRCIGHFRPDQSGIAAIEFALILPVYLMLFFSIISFAKITVAQSQFQSAAFRALSLINSLPLAQKKSITDNEIRDILLADIAAGGYSWVQQETINVTLLGSSFAPKLRAVRLFHSSIFVSPFLTSLIPEPLYQHKVDLFFSVFDRD